MAICLRRSKGNATERVHVSNGASTNFDENILHNYMNSRPNSAKVTTFDIANQNIRDILVLRVETVLAGGLSVVSRLVGRQFRLSRNCVTPITYREVIKSSVLLCITQPTTPKSKATQRVDVTQALIQSDSECQP